jgi:hypothetical protein
MARRGRFASAEGARSEAASASEPAKVGEAERSYGAGEPPARRRAHESKEIP